MLAMQLTSDDCQKMSFYNAEITRAVAAIGIYECVVAVNTVVEAA